MCSWDKEGRGAGFKRYKEEEWGSSKCKVNGWIAE